jgi:hypothetical protein
MISIQRAPIRSLLVFIYLFPAISVAAASLPSDSLEKLLQARGLSQDVRPEQVFPPNGTEVDDYLQEAAGSGDEMLRVTEWQEQLGNNDLDLQVVRFPSGQSLFWYWVLRRRGRGCLIFGQSGYSHMGRKVLGNYWTDDPDMNIPGAARFPSDLYPSAGIPPLAFLRALDSPDPKSSGAVNQQITPYAFTSLDVWSDRVEQITVPAGTFQALRLTMRVNPKSILPSWPGFLLDLVRPLLPENVFYFDSQPPHRFLKAEGVTSIGGPQTVTELMGYRRSGDAP